MAANQSVSAAEPGLEWILGLPALILCGINLIQPAAPMPVFGAAAKAAGLLSLVPE